MPDVTLAEKLVEVERRLGAVKTVLAGADPTTQFQVPPGTALVPPPHWVSQELFVAGICYPGPAGPGTGWVSVRDLIEAMNRAAELLGEIRGQIGSA